MKFQRVAWGILLMGMVMVNFIPPPKPAWGEDTDYTDDVLKSGTFYLSAPNIGFSFSDGEESSSTMFTMHPSLGYMITKNISVGAVFSINYLDLEDVSVSTYGVGGVANAFLPIGPRIYLQAGVGLGYSWITDGREDDFGPDLGCFLEAGYFVNPYLSVGPAFTFEHIFGYPSSSIYSTGLSFRFFFPSKD